MARLAPVGSPGSLTDPLAPKNEHDKPLVCRNELFGGRLVFADRPITGIFSTIARPLPSLCPVIDIFSVGKKTAAPATFSTNAKSYSLPHILLTNSGAG
jgi:hypothetical protein